MNPMGKEEIKEKMGRRKANEDAIDLVFNVVQLLLVWPAFIALTLRIIVSVYGVLVKKINDAEKMAWIITEFWPFIAAWLVFYYALRRLNKLVGC